MERNGICLKQNWAEKTVYAFISWKLIQMKLTWEDGWFLIFDCLSRFCFLLIELHCTFFPVLIKYYHIMFIIIVFWLGGDRPSGRRFFVPALLLSILTPLFLSSSSVPLSYFILAVPIPECLGKHTCMSSPFSIAILNGAIFFRETTWSKLSKYRLSKTNYNNKSNEIDQKQVLLH